MKEKETKRMPASDAFLRGLKQLGIDYIFGNIGTDYPPIVGSLSRFQEADELSKTVPQPIAVHHENVAVHMAYGAFLQSGKPQALMVHTNVGTANALCGMINASRGRIPMIVIAGQAPNTEMLDHTSKPGYIHWAQEMHDQGGMVREIVKWDYVINSDNVAELDLILKRAHQMATAHPMGPVYLTFEPSAMEELIVFPEELKTVPASSSPQPDPVAVEEVALWLAASERPLIISGGTERNHGIMPSLVTLSEKHSIPVATHLTRNVHFPFDHGLHMGSNPKALVEEADLILVLDTDVPYMPMRSRPAQNCRVIHVGQDPVFQDYPRQGFPYDALITSEIVAFLKSLSERSDTIGEELFSKRKSWADKHKQQLLKQQELAIQAAISTGKMTFEWVSKCIADMVNDDLVVVREFDMKEDFMRSSRADGFHGAPNAGGLGWGLGTALGVRLMAPEKTVLTTVGDGCYYFGNPTAAHAVSRAQDLPFITIVFNNATWATVTQFTAGWYPDLDQQKPPLTDLGPRPDFEKVIEAFGGYGEAVQDPQELPTALRRAIDATKSGKQALLNIHC